MPGARGNVTDHARELRDKIGRGDALIGVIGLGYVGLPLSLAFAARGVSVLGFEIDAEKCEILARGECYIPHIPAEVVQAEVAAGRFGATADFGRLDEPDAILICVPTPLTPQREPDLSFVATTAQRIRERLRPGQLVVLESTTYPGTTDELLRGILDESGLGCGVDYFLGFSPEREDPGNARFRTIDIPKVVGGVDAVAGELIAALYARAFGRTVTMTSARAAEATKLTENIFRAVNIALVNELKVIYDRMGIDIWEVLDAAETKPFGYMRFDPGPGWGGHCIPLDPFYLAWKAREFGTNTRFIELAGEVNRQMPAYVVDKTQRALNSAGKPVAGSRILILGVAYKKDVADLRESPAFEVIELLLELGAKIRVHDPHIQETVRMRSWPQIEPMRSEPLTEALLTACDAVVLVTNHTAVDYDFVAEHAALIVDTRGVYHKVRRPNVIPA